MNERKSNAPLRDYRFAKALADKLTAEQFTQTDPAPLGAGSAYESAYVYGLNNPLVYTDPSGLRGQAAQGSSNPIDSGSSRLRVGSSSSGGVSGYRRPRPGPVITAGDVIAGLGLAAAAACASGLCDPTPKNPPKQEPNDAGKPPGNGVPRISPNCPPPDGDSYRSLNKGDVPSSGLRAKNPNANYTVEGHVLNASRFGFASQFISTTRSEAIARGKYGGDVPGGRTVKIDLRQVQGEVYDLTDSDCLDSLVRGSTAKNFARKDQEVLIEGFVPPSAIQLLP
jgi:hypothetical protein